MDCSCCGQDRDPVVALQCHADVVVCRECIGWLRQRSGIVDVTPILPVTDIEAAVTFYEKAGFDVRRWDGGGFAFVSFEDESVFDLDPWDGTLDVTSNKAGCMLMVPDANAWHVRLSMAGLPVTDIADQPWGVREFTLTDPDGNYIRIGHGIDS